MLHPMLAIAAAAVIALSVAPRSVRSQVPVSAVAGTVYDSVAGAPLGGAVVQLVAARTFSATADSLGRYRLDSVPPGRYVAGIIHPSLDLLGLDATLGAVTIRGDSVQQLNLAISNGARTRAAVCGAVVGAETGVLVGQVRDAETDEPINDARVVLTWREIVIEGGRGGRVEPRQAPVQVRPGGYYALCGVPTDDQLAADVAAPERRAAHVTLWVGTGGVTRRDFTLGSLGTSADSATSAPTGGASSAGASSAGAPGRAMLAGVVRQADGRLVAGASVLVLGTDARTTTGDDGRFTLGGLPAGTHEVEARAIGLQPRNVSVDLTARRTASADIVLGPRVTTLETVRVLGRGSRALRVQTAFLDRMKRRGAGVFITAQEIEKLNPMVASDVFLRQPAVQVLDRGGIGSRRGGAARQVWMRSPIGPGLCSPTVYLDGFRVQDGGVDFDALVSARSVVGIEIYRTPMLAPAEYAPTTGTSCGVILVWSKS